MKKSLLYIALAGALALAGCSKDEELGEPQDTKPTWVADKSDANINSMMVTVVDSGMPASVTKDDLLAAFVNGICRGVANPQIEEDGTRFLLSVAPSVTDCLQNPLPVTLKYYSVNNKRVYTSQPFTFAPNGFLGTLNEGYRPTW